MTLYLVRHAIAEERGPDWPDDRVRPLTARGEARWTAVATRLAGIGVTVSEVWTSPLMRARQTAVIAAEIWGAAEVEIVEELRPGVTPPVVVRALARRRAPDSVAVVGHEPYLGELAAHLLGANRPLPFRKGGVARLECTGKLGRGQATLAWMVTPRVVLG